MQSNVMVQNPWSEAMDLCASAVSKFSRRLHLISFCNCIKILNPDKFIRIRGHFFRAKFKRPTPCAAFNPRITSL